MDGTQHSLALKFAQWATAGRIDERNVDSAAMKFLIRLLLLVLPLVAAAQSKLPPCPAFGIKHNCFGSSSIFTLGGKYVGEWKDGKYDGQGTATIANGDKYVGEFKDGKYDGQGTATIANGDKYVGEFKDRKYDGQGTYTFANGTKYVGEFRDGKPNGQGIEYLAAGTTRRSGRWLNGDLAQSFVIDIRRFPFDRPLQTAVPPVDPGEAERDRLAAAAEVAQLRQQERNPLRTCEGTWPTSNWTNCIGTHILPWGEVYVGEYRDGARSGEGIEYLQNGGVNRGGRWDFNTLVDSYLIPPWRFPFRGQVNETALGPDLGRSERDRIAAESASARTKGQELEQRMASQAEAAGGKQQQPEQRLAANAQSQLAACPASGYKHNCSGTDTFGNGDNYVGEFKNDEYSGRGAWTWSSGRKYIGEFANNTANGQGIEYSANGTVSRSGRWLSGSLVDAFALDLRQFPFNGQTQPDATADLGSREPERTALEAEATRRRQQELEQKLAVERERERQGAEAEAARRKQQELEQRMATEADAARLRQQELEQRLTAEARERERQAAEAEVTRRKQQELEQRLATEAREREKQTAEADAARLRQKELEQRLALEAREREKQAAEVEAVRRRQQELEAQLAALQSQAALRPPNPAAFSRNQRRVALVIGNAQYKVSPLDNPVNDATDMDRTLKQLGFQTTLLRNATLGQMREATRRFADQLQSADVALIYFAGHGVESNRKNYMIPVNADLKFEYELDDQAYNAGQWLDMLESIKSSNAERVNIVILDACRNNSLIGARSLGRGLGRMDAPTGTFLAYSTAPGKVAADGARGERNSPFTRHLLTVMQQPGLPIEEAFKEVRRNVSRETNGAQVPWESTSLTGFFTFRQAR